MFFLIISFFAKGQFILKSLTKYLDRYKGIISLDFHDAKDLQFMGITENLSNNQCVITLIGLKPGKYSFKHFQGENNIKELYASCLGVPSEDFGFSNKAKDRFGRLVFKNTVFELKNDTTL
ncbi:MAG: DUF2141 domain-containing protein [Deltaproteobacteria bacterium]